jgi:molybdopterin-containing oxidoreductase family iron-sulfur binding subunit
MQNLNRRDFFKTSATAAAAAGAVACDPRVPKELALPYKVQPEQIVPGTPTFFATQCNECPATCGVVARNREGRIVKLDGNPAHPTSEGALCSMGHAGLQATYSPDRFEGPRLDGAPATWDDALVKVITAIKAAKDSGKQIAWLGQLRTGATGALIARFVESLGGTVLYHEPVSGMHALRAASKAVFGRDDVPTFHAGPAHTILSFGAEFLSTWGDGSMEKGWADGRDYDLGGFVARTVVVEPRIGSSSAVADLHLQAAPGTETLVAMALAKLVADKKNYTKAAKALVASGDPAAAAAAAGVSLDRLNEVADWLATHPSVILPGGMSTGANPTSLAIATLLLNEVAGNIGKTVTYGDGLNIAGLGSHQQVADLIKASADGVLFLDGANPAYTLPGDLNVAEALGKTTVVAFAIEPTDSITSGAIVLPPGSTLETWGDAQSKPGVHTLQQATMMPLKDTRQVGDILLAIAEELGLGAAAPVAAIAEGAPEVVGSEPAAGDVDPNAPAVVPATPMPGLDAPDFRSWLQGWWKAEVWDRKAGKPGSFETFWTDSLQLGGWFRPAGTTDVAVTMTTLPSMDAVPFAGSGDKHLVLFPHPTLLDGRHANKPWAQESPESLSSYTWGTWVEMHPSVAESLGLEDEDEVEVTTSRGSQSMAWFGSPSIRKDTIAVVMGNGHEGSGRYANYGSNPMQLVTHAPDESGALRIGTKASIAKAGTQTHMHKYLGNIDTDGRGVNYVVSVEDLDKGDGPASIVSMHHPPVDQRAIDAGILDMYPEPEHPTYRFAMAIDLNRCNGCGACETACYAENNIPVVGPEQIKLSRHMGWTRLSRYWEGEGETPDIRFQPVMCQQCSHAPCEGVCPVLATYHNLDGLNAMIYNRCVGTRYCANNCPYTARRFNFHSYKWPESFNLMLNPDVVTREMGVMEKCTFCIHKIREAKDLFRDRGETVPDSYMDNVAACAQTCPTKAITFGNLNDPESRVSKKFQDPRAYAMLGELNTKPGVRYLARINYIPAQPLHHGGHGGDHGDSHGDDHGSSHGDAHGAGHGDDGNHGKTGAHGSAGHDDKSGHDGHGDKHGQKADHSAHH